MLLLKICRACLKQGHACEIIRIAFKKFWNDKAQNVLSRKHVSHCRPLLGVTVSKNSPVSIIFFFACSDFLYACTLPMAELLSLITPAVFATDSNKQHIAIYLQLYDACNILD